jgi:hypothetical protein
MAEKLTEKDDSPADDVIIVEDDPKNTPAEATGVPNAEDDRLRAGDDDEDSDDDGAPGPERDAIRQRRRQEKLDRKQRRDEAIKRDKVELDFLRKRNDDLERRLTVQEQRAAQVDLNSLDAQINAAMRDADTAERVIAKAVEAGNGSDVTQAMRYRDQAIEKARQLHAAKQAALQRPASPPAPAIDDATMRHAQDFLSENSWYDPQGRDEDSAIVLAIDQALVKDGFNPQSADYWDELRRRAARRLPERFGNAAERKPRGGPAVGSGREHAPATTRREIYISPERKQALIDAGVWDDPVLRTKYVKRYAEYDRQNRA